jgi:hypothetical protein
MAVAVTLGAPPETSADPVIPRSRPIHWVYTLVAVLIAVVLAVVGTVWVTGGFSSSPAPYTVSITDIYRNITYNGGESGYVGGTTTSGCDLCPLSIETGSTVSLKVLALNFSTTPPKSVQLNVTFTSTYPFEEVGSLSSSPPLVTAQTYQTGVFTTGPGAGWTVWLTLVIPSASSAPSRTGGVEVSIVASAG